MGRADGGESDAVEGPCDGCQVNLADPADGLVGGRVGFTLAVAGVVVAAGPAIQTITPHKADQVTNIDVLRQQLKNYYGDPLASPDPRRPGRGSRP